ncbi:Uncharacterized protein dnm_007650 [Desulfonema magnum]|uniref:Uncharacterized protein n=1 Tax=Desulfonema magnum TaxID=45655 RepID=A0A975GKQ4_9BACT|nr:Uncharacterized protein dnm_007650 [Desulfonema magnum]
MFVRPECKFVLCAEFRTGGVSTRICIKHSFVFRIIFFLKAAIPPRLLARLGLTNPSLLLNFPIPLEQV